MNLPGFQSERRGDNLGIADCTKCKSNTPRLQRQSLGCGYEAPAPKGIPVMTWKHPSRDSEAWELDEQGRERDPVCPGYTCNLPDVIDIARAWVHWSKGALPSFTRTDDVREPLLEGIEVLDGAISALNTWTIEQARKQ